MPWVVGGGGGGKGKRVPAILGHDVDGGVAKNVALFEAIASGKGPVLLSGA